MEYDKDKFQGLVFDKEQEPELAQFIEESKDKVRFNNYPKDDIEYFASRIYELRKNNRNNTAG